jgi:uncharacterized membrane protein YgcG
MKRHIFLIMVVLLSCWSENAAAFWGRESKDAASGLNVAAGFDVNTITTISGTVLTPPARQVKEEHTTMTVASSQGTVTAVLGPWWYWEKQSVSFTINQELAMTGSLAQGTDGALYLFVQHLENRSNGESILLRSESGVPVWSHSGTGIRNGSRQSSGSGPRSGTGSRGSGMRGGRR